MTIELNDTKEDDDDYDCYSGIEARDTLSWILAAILLFLIVWLLFRVW
tara:strand:- start:666 stop:809 length:144 start_codon:yes stop_codon:yes gene_type:complete